MARKKKIKRKSAAEANASVPSPVLLAARLRSGAGKHTDKRFGTRADQRRRAIEEHS